MTPKQLHMSAFHPIVSNISIIYLFHFNNNNVVHFSRKYVNYDL